MATIRASKGKTKFVEDVLAKEPRAKRTRVLEAWKAAGHEGTISATLVQKVKSQLGLTSKAKPSPTATSEPPARRGKASPPPEPAAPESNGALAPTPGPEPRPTARDDGRERRLDELEAEFDRLIFRMMALGGLSDVEDALRRARRLLVLSSRGDD